MANFGQSSRSATPFLFYSVSPVIYRTVTSNEFAEDPFDTVTSYRFVAWFVLSSELLVRAHDPESSRSLYMNKERKFTFV